ncbi:MAG: Uma2 family endonuclease [Bryobacteraceae bacterium]
MATVAQINANRRNARKSTGPKTPAGKVRSAQNALLHGLTSRQIVLNTEDETAFQALYAEFVDEYQPADATERILVQQVAIAAWRLRRIQTLETVLFDYRFVLEPGLWSSEARRRFDQQDPRWAQFRQVAALLDGCSGSDALERLSRYEARVRRSFYTAVSELRSRKIPCRNRQGAVPGTATKPTEAIGRTQSSPAKSTASRQIGFVPPNLNSPPSEPRAEASGPAVTLHSTPEKHSPSEPRAEASGPAVTLHSTPERHSPSEPRAEASGLAVTLHSTPEKHSASALASNNQCSHQPLAIMTARALVAMPTVLSPAKPPAERPEPLRKQWTRTEVEFLESSGRFPGHYELVEGELLSKMGKKRPHVIAAGTVLRCLLAVFGDRVEFEAPIDVAAEDLPSSEPEPDLIVLSESRLLIREGNPRPEEVVLVVEIADTTLAFDRVVKAALYGRARIPEYWILDLNGLRLLVHRHPSQEGYGTISAYGPDEQVSPLAAPSAPIRVGDLLS